MKIILFDIDETLLSCGEANIEGSGVQYSKFVFEDFGENRWKEVIKVIENFPLS